MSGIHPKAVEDAHAYTRSKSPWILERCESQLIHYISGGGMKTFGRLVKQEEARIRHRRFYCVAAGLALLWLVFYLF